MHDFPIGNFQFDSFPDPILWLPEILANKTVQSVHLSDQIRHLSQTMSLIGTQPDIPDEFEGFQDAETPTTPPSTIRPRRVKGRREKSGAPPSAPSQIELIECDTSVRYNIFLVCFDLITQSMNKCERCTADGQMCMRELCALTKLRCVRCAKLRRGCSFTTKGEVGLEGDDLEIVDPPSASQTKRSVPGTKRKASEVSPTASQSVNARPSKETSHSSLSTIPDHATDLPSRHSSMGPPATIPTSSNWAARSSQSEAAPNRSDVFEDSYDSSVTGPPPSGTGSSYSFANSSISRSPSLDNLHPTLNIMRLQKLL